ncbi:MAG: ABC transporter substrate-binding protein [Actinobacteria bacterium 13_2_20CM_2_66_6]|nr:MAG: ABC transporter substrate-binding protein [Actinobacteria bacterium 13_2_20CM_2_66_6]TMF74633.1 MAG: ABC transporter substrate-binding protein [Chloroflexota bacterium]
MKFASLTRHLGMAIAAFVVVTACGSTSGGGTASCKPSTATSVADCGGLDALVTAAKAEGKLNIIATPPDWANYGASINAFSAKYNIKITSANPNGSSQEEVDAVKNLAGTSSAPDVLDVGLSVALANTSLFAPYKVATWNDIPTAQKEASGLWWQDYGGNMGIGYDPSKIPGGTINSIKDLLGSGFKSKVALAGDPTKSNQALNGVIMASLANGGSADDVSKGVDFFHQLKMAGNYVPVIGTAATVKAGQTPVVFEWDYLSSSHGKDVSGWKIFEPSGALLGNYYTQAINKAAPHPAAVRLWEEYLFSDEGQNNWLKGGARPVRMAAMEKSGKLDATAAAALPKVSGNPVFPTPDQQTAAGTYVKAHWSAAVG